MERGKSPLRNESAPNRGQKKKNGRSHRTHSREKGINQRVEVLDHPAQKNPAFPEKEAVEAKESDVQGRSWGGKGLLGAGKKTVEGVGEGGGGKGNSLLLRGFNSRRSVKLVGTLGRWLMEA